MNDHKFNNNSCLIDEVEVIEAGLINKSLES